MTAHRPALATALLALLLSACAATPPKGLALPAATEGGGAAAEAPGDAVRGVLRAPPGGRLVALRVTVTDPPPGLLDDRGAGVLTLRRAGEREPIRLVFLDGALGLYPLRAGIYRVETVAGFDCGDIHLVLAPGEAPLALGGLDLALGDAAAGTLSGRLATPGDLDTFARLAGTDAAAIAVEPLERRQGIACTRHARAASRPDIDPTVRKLTPGEIAGVIVLGGLVGAAGGYAIAAGSFVFVSGTGGGALFLGL
ncbi:MAG: hypothetical protein RQ752_03055 [Thermohalobaculum sp.]|nr:hypothetical protein [Thermohalobaculum sp.]